MANAARWRYGPISLTFWNDVAVRSWSDDGRMLAVYLLSSPYRSLEGFYHLPQGLAADDLGWSAARFAAALAELQSSDFVDVDEHARLVFIVRALKYQPEIKGPPSIKGALNALDRANGSRRLFGRFLAAADSYQPIFAAAIRDHYGLAEGAYGGAR